MTLQDGDGALSLASAGRLTDDEVARGVHLILETLGFGQIDDELAHLVLVLRASGNGENVVEVGPERSGFQISNKSHESPPSRLKNDSIEVSTRWVVRQAIV
jgi:hypothetical protein